MPDYNLGTASGRIVVDGSGAEVGFNVAKTAAGAFFDVVKARVDQVQTLGKRMVAVGTSGAVGFGAAIKVAADFEQQMSGVYAVANANEAQMEALRNKALQLGADTVFSASEAAQALEELVKAGISVEDILNGGADAATALAAAGGVGIPEAATIAANAMNQFELAGKDVGEVADILAGVANTSAADVSGLGQSLAQAGAVANLAGLDFKDTAIAIGEMANAGINGSDAGTSLKTMLNNLIPTTTKQSNLFKELGLLTYDLKDANQGLTEILGPKYVQKSMKGVKDALAEYVEGLGKGAIGTQKNAAEVDNLLSRYGGLNNAFFDAKGNVKDLEGLQGTLAKALKGMSREQKLAALETLFGADAMRASAILSLEGAKGYREFAKGVEATSAADVAAVRLDNLKGSVEQMKGALETAAITVGSVFLPAVNLIVQGITFLINAFNGLPSSVQITIAVLAAVASTGLIVLGAFLALLPVILSMLANFILLRAISGVTAGFKVFFTTLRAGNGAMAASRTAALTTGGAFQKLTARMLLGSRVALLMGRGFIFLWAAITGPIGIAIAAIVALVAIGVLLYKKWEPFRNLVDAIARALMSRMMAAWAAIKAAIPPVLAALQQFGNFLKANILPVLKQVGQELLGKLLEGWNKIKEAVTSQLMPALQQLAARFRGEILPALQELGAKMMPVISAVGKFAALLAGAALNGIMTFGKAFITYVLPILIKVAGFIGGVLIDTIVMLIKGIIDTVTGIIKIFTGLIDFFTGVFTGNWSQAWEGLKSIVSGAVQLIWGLIQVWLAIGVLKLFKLAFSGIWAIVKGGWSLITTITKGAGAGIWAAVKGIFSFIVNIIKGSVKFWWNAVKNAWSMIRNVSTNGGSMLRSAVSKVVSAVVNFFKSMGASAVSAVKSGWARIVEAARSALQRLQTTAKNMLDRVLTFFKQLPGDIKNAFSGLAGDMYKIGTDIILGMINGVKAMAGRLGEAAKDVARGAVSAVKGILNSNSPSKVFMEIGVDTIKGQEIGMEKRRKPLARVAVDAATGMIAAYQAAMNTLDPKMVQLINGDPPRPDYADTAQIRKADRRSDTNQRLVAAGRGGGGEGSDAQRIVGSLTLRNGRAYIEGIVEDVVDERDSFDGRKGFGGQ